MEKYYPVFYGKVINSSLKITERATMQRYIQGLNNQEVEVMIRPKPNRRTAKQNRAYWAAVINQIAIAVEESTGTDRDDVHNYFKTLFLRKKITDPITGELITVVGSTTKLHRDEFVRFVDKCYNLAALPSDEGGFGLVLNEIGEYNRAEKWVNKKKLTTPKK